VDEATCDLSVKNPNRNDEIELREPETILAEITSLDKDAQAVLANISELLKT